MCKVSIDGVLVNTYNFEDSTFAYSLACALIDPFMWERVTPTCDPFMWED